MSGEVRMRDASFFAPRMRRFSASPSQRAAQRVRELIAAGHDIVKLTTGEPDFVTPELAREAAAAFVQVGEVRYTPVNGTLAMREAVREKFRRDNGLDYALDCIAVGAGTKQVLFNALMATVHTGDEVIVPAPYWTSYPDMVKLAGGTPVIVATSPDAGFRMRPQDLEAAITPATKWLLFSSPANPTGCTYCADELRALAEVLLAHPHVHVLSDDVYEHLVFDGREFATLAAVEPRLFERTVTCNGVSKAYSMTGWRVGFAGGPRDIVAEMNKVLSQSTSGTSAVAQAAAVAALRGPLDYVRARTADLQRRRDLLHDALADVPLLDTARPGGAMYLYVGCADALGRTTSDGHVIDSDTDFTEYLLDSVGVAVVQGEAYGASPYVRVSFAVAEEQLHDGAARIRRACEALVR